MSALSPPETTDDTPFRKTPERESADSTTLVTRWLFVCCALIGAMAVIGAITRLSDSGLSIMEWAPLSGTLPPLSQAEWARLFALYKTIPEYRNVNAGMDLAGFQSIFWWEYIHRLWGRLIGVAFALPLAFFWLRGQLPDWLKPHLCALLVLGGGQGAVGWYMVASGFSERTDVSQYRLSLHLMIAVGLYGYLFWLALITPQKQTARRGCPGGRTERGLSGCAERGLSLRAKRDTTLIRAVRGLIALIALTMASGAFVAGLRAGLIYNSFPLMEGQWIPPAYSSDAPWYINSFENMAAVQFHHRILALVTTGAALIIGGLCALKKQRHAGRIAGVLLMAGAMAQAGLGIATLLLVVPLPLAAAHQAGAFVLLGLALYLLFCLIYSEDPRHKRK